MLNYSVTLSVKGYGAKGDGTTDDAAAFQLAINDCVSLGANLVIPAATYKLGTYVKIVGARKLRISGPAATIIYGSDDLTLKPDAFAINNSMARSAFLVVNSQDVAIDDLQFIGGTTQELFYQNVGCGVFASRTVGLRLNNLRQINGATLYSQDAQTDTVLIAGNSLTVSSGTMTLANAAAVFHTGMIGRNVTIANATNPVNNIIATVLSVPTASTLTFANVAGITETSSMVATVNDGDSDTRITNCRWENCRSTTITGNNSSYINCTFSRPLTPDLSGIPATFSISGSTVTMTDPKASWTYLTKGYIKIAGATSAGNNGIFPILTVTPAGRYNSGSITYTNASGVTESAPRGTATWWIAGGERSGIGAGAAAISSASGVVTFTAQASTFRSDDVGKTLVLTDCTTAGNNGNKVITRYISPTQVQYVQFGAVSETYSKVFTVDSFDSTKCDGTVGPTISSTTTSVGVNTLTDTVQAMVVNAYAGRMLTDSAGRVWPVLSNTSNAFTLVGGGLTPAAGAYSIAGGATYGSTHAIYYFAGRSNCEIVGCTFRGVRTTGVKISGSSVAIHDINVRDCYFEECGAGIVAGADDAQEHTDMRFTGNTFVNCAIGRAGWNDQANISLLGSRGVSITDNTFRATRDLTAALVNSGSIGGFFCVSVTRYIAGVTQPVEDVTIARNKFIGERGRSKPSRIASSAIYCDRVGQRAKYRTGGTLTISGSTMTLTDTSAQFSQEDVGSSIQLVNAPNGANNITATVLSVPSVSTLTFTNGAGVGGAVSAGTYRIKPNVLDGQRGGTLSVIDNEITGYGTVGITTVSCVGPDLSRNTFNNMAGCISDDGSVAPRIVGNREITAGGSGARITITTATSWPYISDNITTNPALSGGNLLADGFLAATRGDMGIGVGNSTPVDYPLCGKRGRMVPTDSRAENVFAFGSDLVDGDTFSYNGTAYTYKASGPAGNQFNTLAGLIALLDARTFEDCTDYGTGLAGGSVATGHLKIRGTSTVTANAYYLDTINVLNPTALVIPRNDAGGGESIQYSRGEGPASPNATAAVVWSPYVAGSGGVVLGADDTTAAALISGASGWYEARDTKNAGCCAVVRLGAVGASPAHQLRWYIP